MLQKAISQKSANIYQNFKVTKIEPQSGAEYDGKEYVICDFKYELLTGAGFEVDRRGVAAITSQGPAVEILWAASTRERYVPGTLSFQLCKSLFVLTLLRIPVLKYSVIRRLSQCFGTLLAAFVVMQMG